MPPVRPFPLWRAPDQLCQHLLALIAQAPAADNLAVTMTGELADCYATKAEGVQAIVSAVDQARQHRQARVYLVDGRLAPLDVAAEQPSLAAASNWHALARYASRLIARQPGLLIDVGSTTSDIIPIVHGRPAVTRPDDTSRLIHGQLVYTGVTRSPVLAVAEAVVYRDGRCPFAHELFATMRDAYLTLGELPEDPSDRDTADGRPATRQGARDRLARSICADSEVFNPQDAIMAARSLAQSQCERLAAGIRQVLGDMPQVPETVVVSGQGEFLARQAVECACPTAAVVSLTELLGPDVSRCCAGPCPGDPGRRGESHSMNHSIGPVVKVGGSLFEQPNLAGKLRSWLALQRPAPAVLIAGGGPWAAAVRAADHRFQLGEETAHWLAISAMRVTAQLLSGLLPELHVTSDIAQVRQSPDCVWLLDVEHFLRYVEPTVAGTRLPHSWHVTSDSIAARVAVALGSTNLILLKSALPPAGTSVQRAAEIGYVDRFLPVAAGPVAQVRCVDLPAVASDEPSECEMILSRPNVPPTS